MKKPISRNDPVKNTKLQFTVKSHPILDFFSVGSNCGNKFASTSKIVKTYHGADGCFNMVTNPTVTWYEADAECRKAGGSLAIIPNNVTQDALQSFLTGHVDLSGKDFWIGMMRMKKRDQAKFVWLNRKRINFFHRIVLVGKNRFNKQKQNKMPRNVLLIKIRY